jgi:hypothetical protein
MLLSFHASKKYTAAVYCTDIFGPILGPILIVNFISKGVYMIISTSFCSVLEVGTWKQSRFSLLLLTDDI